MPNFKMTVNKQKEKIKNKNKNYISQNLRITETHGILIVELEVREHDFHQSGTGSLLGQTLVNSRMKLKE